jgi:phage protein D
MTQTRSERVSGLPTDYYAPDFLLEVEGQELDPATKGDVLEVKVVMDQDNLTSADLSISNWDDRNFTFKYSETPTFDLGNRVHVHLGYADGLVSMMRGQIATLSPRFPESGPPTLQVNVLDGMLRLRDAKPAEGEEKQYENLADWQIAERIAERNQLRSEVTREGPVHPLVVRRDLDDARFLMERAKRIDFDVFMVTDPASGDEMLHFVRPTDGRDDRPIRVYQLVWGESLIEFTPTITLSRQVTSVTVNGWDPDAKDAISATATAADLPGAAGGGGTSGPEAAAKLAGSGKREIVVDAPVLSQEEAEVLARALLAERAYEFITGSGRVIGLPDLRPGDNVELRGLGDRFSGSYYVKKVEHTLGSSGYVTQFDVRRVYDPGARRQGSQT